MSHALKVGWLIDKIRITKQLQEYYLKSLDRGSCKLLYDVVSLREEHMAGHHRALYCAKV